MKEDFLHYIWKHKLFADNLVTGDGKKASVLKTGSHNYDAGPDFFNARITIGDTTWAGNVEIHVNSSDWYRHGHNTDENYDNVILQIVYNNDSRVTRTDGSEIPTAVLDFPEKLWRNYEQLMQSRKWIPCEDKIRHVDIFKISFWLNNLMVERLEDKAQAIEQDLKANTNNWEETFYHKLARNFGFKLNNQPFEMLAKSLPLNYLAKHKDDLLQVEALLFGQAGMLQANIQDEYFRKLKSEYEFFRQKFGLQPMAGHLWKFMRSRPPSFPTIRISQFAYLVHKSSALFSQLLEADSAKELKILLSTEASQYWDTHYVFGKAAKSSKRKKLGEGSVENIIINTVVPFVFLYGKLRGKQEISDKALEYLEQLRPENNSVIKSWNKLGIKPENAFQSQGLLQLKNNYCNYARCLECQIGAQILKLDD